MNSYTEFYQYNGKRTQYKQVIIPRNSIWVKHLNLYRRVYTKGVELQTTNGVPIEHVHMEKIAFQLPPVVGYFSNSSTKISLLNQIISQPIVALFTGLTINDNNHITISYDYLALNSTPVYDNANYDAYSQGQRLQYYFSRMWLGTGAGTLLPFQDKKLVETVLQYWIMHQIEAE